MYTIITKTEKATRLKNQSGLEFWVPSRFVRKDLTLTPKGQEIEAAAAKEGSGDVRTIQGKVIRETEKAVLLATFGSYKKTHGDFELWLPKKGIIAIGEKCLKIHQWAYRIAQQKVADDFGGVPSRASILEVEFKEQNAPVEKEGKTPFVLSGALAEKYQGCGFGIATIKNGELLDIEYLSHGEMGAAGEVLEELDGGISKVTVNFSCYTACPF